MRKKEQNSHNPQANTHTHTHLCWQTQVWASDGNRTSSDRHLAGVCMSKQTYTHPHAYTHIWLLILVCGFKLHSWRKTFWMLMCVFFFACDYLCHVHSIGLYNFMNCSATFWHFMMSQNIIINHINIRLITVVSTIRIVCQKKWERG